MIRLTVALSLGALVFIIPLQTFAAETSEPAKIPAASAGVLDLSGLKLNSIGGVPLFGEWDFWWDEFIEPSLFASGASEKKPHVYRYLNGIWSGTIYNTLKLPAHGYATYHLKIKIDPSEKYLGIRIGSLGTAARIYANGRLAAQAGVPGTDKHTSIPGYAPQVARIPNPVDGTIDLVMHISNFHYKKGGPWSTLYIGSFDRLISEKNRADNITTFYLGSFFMMAVFHGILFLMRRKEWPSLFMSLFCLALALRVSVTQDYFILTAFPKLPFSLVIRMEYASIFLAAASVANMFQRVYPREIRRKVLRIFTKMVYALIIVVALTPTSFSTYTTDIFFPIAIPLISYCGYGLIQAIGRKRKGAAISFASLLIVGFSYINDYLFVSGILKTGYISNFTLLVFVLCQAGVLSARLTNAFSEVETLSLDLEILNSQLEFQVKERTEELEIALEEIRCISVLDELTGCHNRRYMDEQFPVEIERAIRYGRAISVIMSDIDFFKSVNDTYGHQTGDRVIAFIGKAALNLIRDKIDIAVRYGGEEFLLILPETGPDAARIVADKIRVYIEANTPLAAEVGFPVTASFGVSGFNAGEIPCSTAEIKSAEGQHYVAAIMQKLVKDADDNMYRAKNEGRNRVAGP